MSSEWQKHVNGPSENSLLRLTMIVYALQAASFLAGGLTLIAGVIINYVRREDVQDTWLESHFRWQIRTFWLTLVWATVGGITAIFLIGWVILTATLLWLIYRIVKGWVLLSERRTAPA